MINTWSSPDIRDETMSDGMWNYDYRFTGSLPFHIKAKDSHENCEEAPDNLEWLSNQCS